MSRDAQKSTAIASISVDDTTSAALTTAISYGYHEVATLLLNTEKFNIRKTCPDFQSKTARPGLPRVCPRTSRRNRKRRTAIDQRSTREWRCECQLPGLHRRRESTTNSLTAAAATHGDPEVIRLLLAQPGIDPTLSWSYGLPPLLHLLQNDDVVATPEGLSLLQALSAVPFVDEFDPHSNRYSASHPPFEIILKNALFYAPKEILQVVIQIVRGSAGGLILRLLVWCADIAHLNWLLSKDNLEGSLRATRHSWIYICEHLQENENVEGFQVFNP
ncbi:hypothetical protein AJ79_01641 [Helicocarpus griseus UAMH5409]|uniref:Uncharacterized protein n=1 Tax=Helicocarpus griseus UAMH5409 TaxID=1447875 RepID=A0A2B7Y4W8_9EURO|nr:hypothetical protein AJ79_01641 [Helicocarpus griseus UAMH5409]